MYSTSVGEVQMYATGKFIQKKEEGRLSIRGNPGQLDPLGFQ
jgi:hypothetical protein